MRNRLASRLQSISQGAQRAFTTPRAAFSQLPSGTGPNTEVKTLEPEPLPWWGGEYWFAYHTAPASPNPHHLIIAGGRARSPITIDGQTPGQYTGQQIGDPPGELIAATIWGYHRSTPHRLYTGPLTLSNTPDGLTGTADDIAMKITGTSRSDTAQPAGLTVARDETPVIELEYSDPGDPGYGVERDARFLGPVGYALVNHHLTYTGQWTDDRITGRAYVQKVRVVGPLVPWRWAKLYFADGSTVTGFWPRATDPLPYVDSFAATPTFFDASTDTTHRVSDLRLVREGDRWTLTTPDETFAMTMRIQTERTLELGRKTTLSYTEYPVTVTDARVKINGKTRTSDDLGPGSGLVEHTTGVAL